MFFCDVCSTSTKRSVCPHNSLLGYLRRSAQVVSALGPRFGEEGSSSEAVDFKGVQSAIEAAEAFLGSPGGGDGSPLSPGDEEKSLIVPRDGSSGAGGPGGEFSVPTTTGLSRHAGNSSVGSTELSWR